MWLYRYAGNGDYDGPVLIVRRGTLGSAGIRTGSLIVLDDDVRTTAGKTAAPAAEVLWISRERG